MTQEFIRYRRTQIAEMRPYEAGERLEGVSIGDVDRAAGSPRAGDMIARNPANDDDLWLVAAAYFTANFAPEDDPDFSEISTTSDIKDQEIAQLQEQLRICEAARDAARADRDQSDAQLRELSQEKQ